MAVHLPSLPIHGAVKMLKGILELVIDEVILSFVKGSWRGIEDAYMALLGCLERL
jgi:hypothetical protein